jgi:hypothetical protein
MLINLEMSRRKAGDIVGFVPNPLYRSDGGGGPKSLLALLEKPRGADITPHAKTLLEQHPDLATRGARVNVLFLKLLHGGGGRNGVDFSQVRAVICRPVLPTDLCVVYDGFCEVPVAGLTRPAVRSVARLLEDPTRQDFAVSPGYTGVFVAKGAQAKHAECGYIAHGSLADGLTAPLAGLDSLHGFGFFQSRLRGAVTC